MSRLRGAVYNENNKGPRTEPCGTLNWRALGRDRISPNLMLCAQFVRYDLSQHDIYTQTKPDRRDNNIEWSIVSNAADRSRRVKAVTLPFDIFV